MKKSLKSKIVLALSLIGLSVLMPMNVHAYSTYNDYILENGIRSMRYWIHSDASSYWESICDTGIENWNASNTDFSFRETTSQSTSKIDFYIVADSRYPDLGGQTQFYVNNSTVNPENENWFWTKILLNPYSLSDTTTTTDKSVATHEVGHAIGLAHVKNVNVLMHPYYNEVRVSTPQRDDVNGVNYLY